MNEEEQKFASGMDRARIEAGKAILSGPSCLLFKPCRAGATTSLAIAAEEMNKSLLLVAPTNAILDRTLKRASTKTPVKIAANSFCLKWKPEIEADPFLANLPLPIQDCRECKHFQICDVTEILRSGRRAGEGINYGITYHKLASLMLSKSETAESIRKKLHGLDAIIPDEAHLISLHQPPRVPVFSCSTVSDEFPALWGVSSSFQDLCYQYINIISELLAEGQKGHVGKHLSRSAHINNPIPFKIQAAAYNELVKLTGQRDELGISEDAILMLRDICSIMGGSWCTFGYVSEQVGEAGRVYAVGNVGMLYHALTAFLSSRERTTKIFTSGTLLEPYIGFFKELAGCHLEDAVFPEANSASRSMEIIPDRWTLDSKNFNRRFEDIISRIIAICRDVWPERCYIIAPTAAMAGRIRKRLSVLMPEMRGVVDYYRSDGTIGVERTERVCIAVGMAHVPSNAYDHLARGRNSEERAVSSAMIRNQSVQAATWQAWNRIKDPSGEHESKVFCIGVRAHQAADCATWGANRRLELIDATEQTYGDSPEKARKARKYHFKVVLDHALDMPLIQAEPRADCRADRVQPDELILNILPPDEALTAKAMAKDNENIIKAAREKLGLCYVLARYTENQANALYISNRLFARKDVYCVNTYHGILTGYDEDRDKVAAFLALYFCHRTDYYALQAFDNTEKKWVFYPEAGDLNDYTSELIKRHLRADLNGLNRRFTMGVYEIDPETDTVSWICFDLDRHKPEDPDPKDAVQRLLSVLDRCQIPYLLESSGSPDSYHVWVFLVPTRTCNAYYFSRQLKKAAKITCEIWPKQRAHSGRSGADFGNLVKLPLGHHNKTGRRSCFLDPKTFEPLEYVQFPGLVRLFEQPDKNVGLKGKYKSKRNGSNKSINEISTFRQCLKAVLESGNYLEGSEGNEMRVAIGAEAKSSGISLDEAIRLFSNVPDFNEDITRKYLEYIYSAEYRRYRCDTLLEKSGSIMYPYCLKCSQPWASANVLKYFGSAN